MNGKTAPRGTAKHAALGRRSTKIPTVPEADSPTLLIAKQAKELPDASADLLRLGCGRGHWMWWVFDTSSCGNSEPLPRTRVPRGWGTSVRQGGTSVRRRKQMPARRLVTKRTQCDKGWLLEL